MTAIGDSGSVGIQFPQSTSLSEGMIPAGMSREGSHSMGSIIELGHVVVNLADQSSELPASIGLKLTEIRDSSSKIDSQNKSESFKAHKFTLASQVFVQKDAKIAAWQQTSEKIKRVAWLVFAKLLQLITLGWAKSPLRAYHQHIEAHQQELVRLQEYGEALINNDESILYQKFQDMHQLFLRDPSALENELRQSRLDEADLKRSSEESHLERNIQAIQTEEMWAGEVEALRKANSAMVGLTQGQLDPSMRSETSSVHIEGEICYHTASKIFASQGGGAPYRVITIHREIPMSVMKLSSEDLKKQKVKKLESYAFHSQQFNNPIEAAKHLEEIAHITEALSGQIVKRETVLTKIVPIETRQQIQKCILETQEAFKLQSSSTVSELGKIGRGKLVSIEDRPDQLPVDETFAKDAKRGMGFIPVEKDVSGDRRIIRTRNIEQQMLAIRNLVTGSDQIRTPRDREWELVLQDLVTQGTFVLTGGFVPLLNANLISSQQALIAEDLHPHEVVLEIVRDNDRNISSVHVMIQQNIDLAEGSGMVLASDMVIVRSEFDVRLPDSPSTESDLAAVRPGKVAVENVRIEVEDIVGNSSRALLL